MYDGERIGRLATFILCGWTAWAAGCAEPQAPPGPVEVEAMELSFTDPSRDTPTMGQLEGAPERRIDTLLWLPAAPDPRRPLVLMAHGIGGDPLKLEAFGRHVASQGYAVAAVRFPASHGSSGAGALGVGDLPEQPADLAFVLDQLHEAVRSPDHDLYDRFADDRVAALGHSLGGATVLGWTRFADADPRVQATVLVAPAVFLTIRFGREPHAHGPPTLILQGAEDDTVPPVVSEDLFEHLEPPTWLVMLQGAYHSDLVEDQSEPAIPVRAAAQQATVAFLNAAFRRQQLPWRHSLLVLADQGHDVRPPP